MASDLEKFLQQAAERLAQKANASGRGGAARPAPAPPSSPRPQDKAGSPRQGERYPPLAEIIEAQVVESDQKRERAQHERAQRERAQHERAQREAGPDPLSTIDTRPSLAQAIGQTDERMITHVHEVFDHELTNLRTANPSLVGTQPNQTDQATEVVTRAVFKSPLLQMLRDPQSLRAAFIVGEIFNRRP